MKFLLRGKTGFLEAELEEEPKFTLKPTDKEVDPKTLAHFGTDLMSRDYNIKRYMAEMEKIDIDYLFVSGVMCNIAFDEFEQKLRIITAYKKIK
jgi:hypothetical protein